MHFSCKISHAVLIFLEKEGEDLSPLYDPSFPPMETLRDPSGWMSAPEMEGFFEVLQRMNWAKQDGSIFKQAGHKGPKNYAWGVLDSVLRMMPRPQEIFHQPERFLSYFISPEPPIENLQRDEKSLSFDLPLPAEQYPLVTTYLRAAFESLPLYVGQGLAVCEWEDIHLKILWPEVAQTLFEKEPGHQISPDLLQSVIADHQKLLRELEDRNREILSKDEELVTLRLDAVKGNRTNAVLAAEEALSSLHSASSETQTPGFIVGQNLARLHDYMVRAQQLIVVLSGLAKKEKEHTMKEALRRLDWDHVKAQYPRAIADSVEALRRLQNRPTPLAKEKEEIPHV